MIMASEVGVLHIEPQNIKAKGRLQPGRMFLVDFEQGRLIPDDELKRDFASRRPYGEWLNRQRIDLNELQHRQGAARLRAENAARADAGVRLHGRNDAVHAAAAGARAARPRRLDGQRLRPGRASPTSRGCSTTISSSSSPRSPTRRSIRSAKK